MVTPISGHNVGMVRPCFLVVDREHSASISTRKLVIETAKMNVITAYSSQEAIETLEMFPAVHGVVLDAGMKDMPCGELVKRLKQLRSQIPIVVIGTPRQRRCSGEDHFLESFEIPPLLELLKKLEPEKMESIVKRDEDLAEEETAMEPNLVA